MPEAVRPLIHGDIGSSIIHKDVRLLEPEEISESLR
jgi:hypothetical protein